jgi:hypothetical protein
VRANARRNSHCTLTVGYDSSDIMKFRLDALRLAVVWLVIACATLGAARTGLPRAWSFLTEAALHRKENLSAARLRVFGDYASAVTDIQNRLPEGEDFLLVGVSPEGTHFFVHYDLAPRRSPYLGLGVAADPEKCRRLGRPPNAPRYSVVIQPPGYLPKLVATDEFFAPAVR